MVACDLPSARSTPKVLDAAVANRASLLKSKAALQVDEVATRHADLTRQLGEGESGSLERAFVAAYDAAETLADTSNAR